MQQSPFIWWKHGVVYQIYPRSFMDSNGDGVGDLQGIINRLDYVRDLGVNAIWLSPIYPSPMADFGYDVADYKDIHPLFGNLETFDRLVEAAHARNLKIILDYVPNHSSDEHPWFVESRSSRDNPRRDWYIWRDAAPDGSPPNNWEAFFGGSAWEWDAHTQQYYLHLFHRKQPDLNWRNPAVVEAMHEVLHFWLRRGVDGFRMDVVTYILKHPDMLDNPYVELEMAHAAEGVTVRREMQHRYNINQPEVHHHLRQFREIVDSYPGERVTIGETWFFDPAELAEYYGENLDELHLPFNFTLMKQPWDALKMRAVIGAYYAALPEGATPNFVLGSHDEHRLATRFGHENHRSAALLLLTLRGAITLYYGDELGMENGDIPPDMVQDPPALQMPERADEVGRDPERTPMQWDASANAGFAPAGVQPWLPVNASYPQVNVAAQLQNPQSTLHFYHSLLHLRRELPALTFGELQFLDELPNHVMAYTRQHQGQTLLVLINFGHSPRSLTAPPLPQGRGQVLLSTGMDRQGELTLAELTLGGNEGLLLELH